MQKIVFVGLGAVGATFAAQFLQAGCDVQVLCSRERKERYLASGFTVNGRPVSFRFVTPDELVLPAELLLIAVKHHHLPEVLDLMAPAVGPDTMIVSLLNGIDSEEIIAARYGEARVLPALVARIDAVKTGTAVTYTRGGKIFFGEEGGESSERARRLAETLLSAGIDHELSADIRRRLWWKFMLNVGVNQAAALLRAPYGVFQAHEPARELARTAMREVIALAQKLEIGLTEEDMAAGFAMMGGFAPDGKVSMLQDVEAKRKTEVEMFGLKVCGLGEELGVPTPVNRVFYQAIRALEASYGAV
jgi:2-dehydropantoate 2-reductase